MVCRNLVKGKLRVAGFIIIGINKLLTAKNVLIQTDNPYTYTVRDMQLLIVFVF